MKKITKLCLCFLLTCCYSSQLIAQARPDSLTIEDIFKNGTYRQKGYGPVRWMKDNKGYSTLENNEGVGGDELVKYDAQTGNRSVLVSAKQLIPQGKTKPLLIEDYTWSADNSKLLIFTNSRKVWRYNTRGDYWMLDLKTGKLGQLGKTVEPSTMMFAKFSPDGSRVAYVSKQNIYVENMADGKISQITKDGGKNIINGTFDWVYEEELDCRDGFRWSPDGKYIAYWQSDTKNVGTFYLINNIDSIYSKPLPFPYPKVGTGLSAVKIGFISADGGTTRWLKIPGKPDDNYLARMDFIPGSNEVMIQQLNRLQNTNMVWVANMLSMKLTNILIDKDEAFLDLHDNIEWLDEQKSFTWTSERDGWRHLYKVSRNGNKMQLITQGNFDVVKVDCIDAKGGYVYYTASPENFTQRYLYRSRLDGRGKAERISPEALSGQHSYQVSPDAKFAIHTFNNTITPPRIAVVELDGHKQIRMLEDNQELKDQVNSLNFNPKEFIKVDIGGITLDAWMIRPKIDTADTLSQADTLNKTDTLNVADSVKKYPVIFMVYGEPAGSTVQDSWQGGDLWHHYLAQTGYVVVSIDNRGTSVPRGRDWRKSIYGKIGILATEDQNKATQKILSEYSFIDSSRVGIWGWSGGGSMTLNCMFKHPETYKTGIAVAFVVDQRLYDATYQERYMGLPAQNVKGYSEGSPITHAAALKGNLLLVHGTGDDNVHYQNFEMLVDELIKQDKLFQMLSYPMRSHGIYEGENTSVHLRKAMEKFWKENL